MKKLIIALVASALTFAFSLVSAITSPQICIQIKQMPNAFWQANNYSSSNICYINDTGFLFYGNSLYRFECPLSSDSVLSEITVGNLSNVPIKMSIVNNSIYINKEIDDLSLLYDVNNQNYGEYLMVSSDLGYTWTEISKEFIFDNNDGYGEFIAVPYNFVQFDDRVYCSPSQDLESYNLNLFYYDKSESTWQNLWGEHSLVTGLGFLYSSRAWDICNGIVVGGSEGPDLDSVAIVRAQISDSGTEWEIEPYEFASTNAGTLPSATNYMAIRANQLTGTFLIGEEGGILRMTEQATKIEYVVSYDRQSLELPLMGTTVTPPLGITDDDPSWFPYVRNFLFASVNSNYVIASGFDKGNAMAYLAWSEDDGKTWTNLSKLVDDYDGSVTKADVPILSEDPSGRIIIGVLDNGEGTLTLLELKLPNPLNDFDADATHLGSGWQYSPTLGYVWGSFYPWLWSYDEQAWIYASGDIASDAWLYDEDLAWLWTNADFYPWMWDYECERWIYFVEADEAGRTFYDANSGMEFIAAE
jgi:hypothetical protein